MLGKQKGGSDKLSVQSPAFEARCAQCRSLTAATVGADSGMGGVGGCAGEELLDRCLCPLHGGPCKCQCRWPGCDCPSRTRRSRICSVRACEVCLLRR